MESLIQLNSLLNQPNTFVRNISQIILLANQFITNFENKDTIAGDGNIADELRPILATISDPAASIPVEVDIIIASILKILLRKPCNRLSLGKYGMSSIIRSMLRLQTGKNITASAEMCNVVLNTCYDGANVQLLVELNGIVPILKYLKSKETAVLCSSLGALQGLCYVPLGRQTIRQNSKVSNS